MSVPAAPAPVSRPRTPLRVDVWTDLTCPWCYVGKHRLERAVAAADVPVELVLHSFELHPEWPVGASEPVLDIAARVHGVDPRQARTMEEGMARQAAAEGLPFVVDRPVGNTAHVHRVLHLAAESGVGTAFFTDLQTAYFAGRVDPFDPEQLVAAAVRHAVPEPDTRRVLASDEYADSVHADQVQARALGITGVPFTVVGGRLALAGAQSVQGYGDVLARASAAPYMSIPEKEPSEVSTTSCRLDGTCD